MTEHQSYFHEGGQRPLLGLTVDEMFRKQVEAHGDSDALVSVPQNRRFTYAELNEVVEELARGLTGIGVRRGTRFGIWGTDNWEWVAIQLATARIGAILVNVNPAYRVGELEHALRLARVEALVLMRRFRSSDYAAMILELCPEARDAAPGELRCHRLPDLRQLILYEPDAPDGEPGEMPGRAFRSWPELRAPVDETLPRETLDFDDPINIQFTSGTTGAPKAVVLTHHGIVNNGHAIAERMGFTSDDRLCVPVPFYHCFGMVVSNLACLSHGAAIVIPADHFEAGSTLHTIETERCTALHGVPTMFAAELDALRDGDYDLSSLRIGIMAGAPCPPELVRRVREELHCPEILIGYGQTEASPVTHLTRPDDSFQRRVETVGALLPHQECKVIDPGTGEMMPIGSVGEICFRGYQVMRGYFDQPEATVHAVDHAGWLHSGDLGTLDADGYLRITGRLKDMIIRGGENIYPAEIEAFYATCPAIHQIAVFGVPDEFMGEEVAAFVQLREGQSLDAEGLRNLGRGHIAHYKIPRYLWIVEEFPMTVTGKIQKFRMREIAEGWLREDVSCA